MNKQELIGKYEQKIAPYYNDGMKADIKNAGNALDILDVFLEYLPSAVFLEIINAEIPSAGPDFKVKLELMKNIAESSATLDFTVPPMQPLPVQKKMTQAEAEELASQRAAEWTKKSYSGKSKDLKDLVNILLLTNEFEVSDGETDLIKRIKGKGNVATWFSFTGANIWPSAKVLTSLAPDPYLLVNLSLRMSYFDDDDDEMTLRLLRFDEFKNYDNITDFRHLETIVAQQKLISGINPKNYVATSDGWYDYNCAANVNPEAIWPFFAENMAYIDKGLCIYNPDKPDVTIYTDYATRILSYFPSLPERYYYIMLNGLFYWPGRMAYECFRLLKNNYPAFEKTLQEYAQAGSKIVAARAGLWLAELHDNPQPATKRYFISKKGDQFWNIWQSLSAYVTESGELESPYPHKSYEYTISVGEAKRTIDETIAQKKKEGYKETDENGVANAIKARNEKALNVFVKKLEEGRTLITPPAPVKITVDNTQPVLDASGQPYQCVAPEGILTDTTDVNYMKATIQHLIGYIAQTKFDAGEDFIAVGTMVKNKYTPLAFKKGKYCIGFDVLCTEAYKHPELHDWLVALLQTITEANNADEPIWADPQTTLGTCLAFLLAQERKYAQPFMDYMHSIQPVDNHNQYAGEFGPGDLPVETLMQLLAGFYANSVCAGDMEDEALYLTKKFKKEQSLMFIAYLEIECKYLLEVKKRYANSIVSSVEYYFSEFHKAKDTDPQIMAKLFVEYVSKG